MEPKVILLNGFSNEEAVAVMHAVKAAVDAPGDIAFAVTTETNRTWKLSELIGHVAEEHRWMKAREGKGKPS